MIKIVCDEDGEYYAKHLIEAAQHYPLCPPLADNCNPCVDCKECIAGGIKIEVIKDSEGKA